MFLLAVWTICVFRKYWCCYPVQRLNNFPCQFECSNYLSEPFQSLPAHKPPWHLHGSLLSSSTFLLTYSLKLPLFGNNSRIPLVPDVHCICLYFYDYCDKKSNTCNLWDSRGEDSGLYFQFRVVYGAHHIKNISSG